MEYLLQPSLIALTFFGACLWALWRKHYENALTRLLICAWFTVLVHDVQFDTDTIRIVGRWLVLCLGLTEVLFGALSLTVPIILRVIKRLHAKRD